MLQYSPNGHIRCTTCDSLWCAHTEAQVVDHSDSVVIWNRSATTEPLVAEMSLAIPMFPTVNLWTTVQLVLDLTFAARYEVHWNRALGEFVQIGSINRGEGRRVIREMLVEHMYGDRARPDQCEAGIHFLKAEKNWQASRFSPQRAAWDWCVYTTGMCLTCLISNLCCRHHDH